MPSQGFGFIQEQNRRRWIINLSTDSTQYHDENSTRAHVYARGVLQWIFKGEHFSATIRLTDDTQNVSEEETRLKTEQEQTKFWRVLKDSGGTSLVFASVSSPELFEMPRRFFQGAIKHTYGEKKIRRHHGNKQQCPGGKEANLKRKQEWVDILLVAQYSGSPDGTTHLVELASVSAL